jgi:hypothetical protein
LIVIGLCPWSNPPSLNLVDPEIAPDFNGIEFLGHFRGCGYEGIGKVRPSDQIQRRLELVLLGWLNVKSDENGFHFDA